MTPISTPAIILATWRYGETSKIVRLATRDHGVQGVIAKGALRPRSRFGAALQVLSGGTAHFLHREGRELHTLTGFDLQSLPVRLTRDVGRYATGTVLAELMLRVVTTEPHPEGFQVLRSALAALEEAPAEALDAIALQSVWRLVTALGVAPSVERCVRDGRPLEPSAELAWSLAEGGAVCERCARGTEVTVLPPEGAAVLRQLLSNDSPLPTLDARHAAAHRRLVARFIHHHLGEGAPLAALDFWQQRAWVPA